MIYSDEVITRFWSRTEADPNGGCILWSSTLTHDGYGRFYTEGKIVMAHRFAYEALVGPIPEGLQMDHLCRVRSCVNPRHLEPVTARENALRGIGPAVKFGKRTHCGRGHPYAEFGFIH